VPPLPREQAARPTAEERREHFANDGRRSLRERVAEARWRQRVAARRSLDHAYRVVVGILGGLVVAVGLVTIPLPGPGWLTVIAGLFLLSTEFMWAERLLEFTKRNVTAWTDWLGRRPMWVRLGIGMLTAAFVCGVVIVVLHVTGVPDWVPGWVPLWR
jgi:uncharacterized protein (TIGR02611 family)